jgi:hypothetical protein
VEHDTHALDSRGDHECPRTLSLWERRECVLPLCLKVLNWNVYEDSPERLVWVLIQLLAGWSARTRRAFMRQKAAMSLTPNATNTFDAQLWLRT